MDRIINKICIFDWDSTLCFSPENTLENRNHWESVTGMKWVGNGWWGKLESLDCNVFDIKMNSHVLNIAKEYLEKSDVYTVILTGRVSKFENIIKDIMYRHDMKDVDAYHFNDSHNTLDFKLRKIEEIANRFPSATIFEMWEDREEHIPYFIEWGVKRYGDNFIMNKV
jgi:hypothetical protein